jgi:hypothetical protein
MEFLVVHRDEMMEVEMDGRMEKARSSCQCLAGRHLLEVIVTGIYDNVKICLKEKGYMAT